MILRKQYIAKLIALKDKQVIKVITGIRRVGKSTLLELFKEYLLSNGVSENNIISISFDMLDNRNLLDYIELYKYIADKLNPNEMNYVFLDEIQEVKNFQKTVNSLFAKKNVDLYITGSNAYLFSSELATLLSGRYIEIKMLPFSFKEYYSFVKGDKKEAFWKYFQNGGFPYVSQIKDEEARRDYLEGVFNTVIIKDVLNRKSILDINVFYSLVRYLMNNIGNIVSIKKIADSLKTFGYNTTPTTIGNYIDALKEAFVFYKAERYDVRGKELLRSLEKYYLVDLGFLRAMFKENRSNIGFGLENIIYLELLRRGYKVMIGKIGDNEVDFIAEKEDERIYFQVAYSVLDPSTFAREIAPLKRIRDNYPKYILSLDDYPMYEGGIKTINIIDFLLQE